MPTAVLYLADIVAILVLVFGLYVPRHHRRDLASAYLGVNVGVLAVSGALSSATVGAGLGLGLFGVLSIIRLRSDELAQHEVAYYFSALALGLLGGLQSDLGWGTVGLMALIVSTMAAGDHPRLLRRHRRQVLVLDGAQADEAALRALVAARLGATVHSVSLIKLDLVNDTTTVEVRYTVPSEGRHPDGPAGQDAGIGRSDLTRVP